MSLQDHYIAFIGGIHGVGKSEFCRELSLCLEVQHITASDLIRRYSNHSTNGQKQVNDINGNQKLLIQALNNYHFSSRNIILDGHFCLLGKAYTIQAIPILIFRLIEVRAVIVLTNDPNIIQDRLKSRGDPDLPIEFIKQFQEREIRQANLVCQSLAIPILILDKKPNIYKATVFLQEHLLQQ